MLIGNREISTRDVARAVGTTTRQVRRVIGRGYVHATKSGGGGGRFEFTLLYAVLAAILLYMRRSGLGWTEMPEVLSRGQYNFPEECPSQAIRYVLQNSGPGKLLRYLLVMHFDAVLLIRSKLGDPRTWLECWEEDEVPHIDPASPVRTTFVAVRPIWEVIRRSRTGPDFSRPLALKRGRLPDLKKKRPVLARPAPLQKTVRNITSSSANLTVWGAQSKAEPSGTAVQCVVPASQALTPEKALENQRISMVDSLVKAMEMATDPLLSMELERVRRLGSLLEDVEDVALKMITTLMYR
jgi:hypothetical protein